MNNAQTVTKKMSKLAFKYWLRINGYKLAQFGAGMKHNPIKLKTHKLWKIY